MSSSNKQTHCFPLLPMHHCTFLSVWDYFDAPLVSGDGAGADKMGGDSGIIPMR